MSLGPNASLNGFTPLSLPELTQDISQAPVDTARSNAWKTDYTTGGVDHIHMDTTLPYEIVDTTSTVPLVTVDSADESDLVPVPLTTSTTTENGILGNPGVSKDPNIDHHSLILDRATCSLFELYQTKVSNGQFSAYSETVWDMTRTERRPYGFTSADVAGLSVFLPLLRYDEVSSGNIGHALRMTFNNTSGYIIAPATHTSGHSLTQTAILGARLRLRADYPETGFSAANVTILRALKKYGAIIADNGANMYITGTLDNRWNQDDLQNLGALTENDFDMVQSGAVIDSANYPAGPAPVISSLTASVANGQTTLHWVVTGDSYDYFQEYGLVTGLSTLTLPYKAGATYTLVSNSLYGRTVQTLKVK